MGEYEAESTDPEEVESLLEPLLRNGDAFLVRKKGDSVSVTPSPTELPHQRSSLERSHPRLYGELLVANQGLSDASGCGVFLPCFLLGVGVCFAIQSQAFHGLFAGDVEAQRLLDGLRSWWIYSLVGALALGLWNFSQGRLERLAYQRARPGILAAFSREGINFFELLAAMEGDEALEDVVKAMKRDKQLSEGL